MKKLFKYFVLILGISFVLPGMVDAAGIKLEKKETTKNSVTYDVLYDKTGETQESINIKINNPNDGLIYSMKISDGIINQSNGENNYVINVKEMEGTATVASITITNNLTETKEVILSVNGTYSATTDPIKINSATTTTTTTQKVKSNDATLSGLTVSTGTFDQAFSKDIMEYSITGIKDTINSINVTPTCDNGCSWSITCPTGGCSVSSTRKVTLQNGANKVAINVVSEDETANKTYILNIYRGEVVTSSAYLEELKIKDGKLSPNFDPMVNDYSIEVEMDIEKLDIITTTEDPNAEVTIKGNEKLVEGENTITITVTSSDGESKQVYTILVNKLAEEDEDEKTEKVPTTKVEKKENNTLLIVVLSLLGLGLIIVVFLIIFKKKKNKKNKNDKNDKNNKPSGKVEEVKSTIEDENTETLNILKETKDMFKEEPKDDIDEALDDLMKTKRLELGDLDF